MNRSLIINPLQRFGLRVFYAKTNRRTWCKCEAGIPEAAELVKIICGNESIQYRLACRVCGVVSGTHNLPHNQLRQHERDNARIYRWNVQSEARTCERCGYIGIDLEVHHWAPQALFYDAEHWPTSLLCRTCHVRWHQVISGVRRGDQ